MTQEEKAKAYDEALERARKLYNSEETSADVEIACETIFPELAESEDERIRKAIITFFESEDDNTTYALIPKKDILAWLEKQGEQKPIVDGIPTATNYDKWFQNCKVPKFKVGDWITNGDYTWKIVEVKPLDYILQSQNDSIVDDTISHVDEHFHSFTIEDAKDGDILVNGSNIFIFSHLSDTRAMGYCHINIDDERFYDDKGKNECFGLIDAVFSPATKEQHDLLFEKMKEAGYEWDAEKKELKKAEEPELTAFEDALKDMMNAYRDAIGDNDVTTEEIKKHAAYMLSLIPNKPAELRQTEQNLTSCKNDTILDLLQKMPSCITVDGIDYHFVMAKHSYYIAYYKGNKEEYSGNAIFGMTAYSPIDLLTEMLEKLKKEGLLE